MPAGAVLTNRKFHTVNCYYREGIVAPLIFNSDEYGLFNIGGIENIIFVKIIFFGVRELHPSVERGSEMGPIRITYIGEREKSFY